MREVRQCAQRVEAPLRELDGPVGVPHRADLRHAARAEAVDEKHGVTVTQQRIGTKRKPLGELVLVACARRIHPAASMQCDDRRASVPRRLGGQQQHRVQQHGGTVRVAVERWKGDRLDAARVCGERDSGTQQGNGQAFHRVSRKCPSSRHRTSFSAIGSVYAGLVDGITSVA
jgi:hypothetical protein